MNTSLATYTRTGNFHNQALTLDAVRAQAPAVFATGAHDRLSSKYTFIPTERVLQGLLNVGFVPVDARQTHTRKASPLHARHIVRLRRRVETIQLRDSICEVVFLNSHDGTTGYQLRMGLFRVVCLNGLIVSKGAFPGVAVAHRGNVVDEVVEGALKVADRFDLLAAQVERMEARQLFKDEQLTFADRALALRYPAPDRAGMRPSQLLIIRRAQDMGEDLWSILNRCQENLLMGGLVRHSDSGRLTRTRRISSIREDLRINSGLWDIATELLAT